MRIKTIPTAPSEMNIRCHECGAKAGNPDGVFSDLDTGQSYCNSCAHKLAHLSEYTADPNCPCKNWHHHHVICLRCAGVA